LVWSIFHNGIQVKVSNNDREARRRPSHTVSNNTTYTQNASCIVLLPTENNFQQMTQSYDPFCLPAKRKPKNASCFSWLVSTTTARCFRHLRFHPPFRLLLHLRLERRGRSCLELWWRPRGARRRDTWPGGARRWRDTRREVRGGGATLGHEVRVGGAAWRRSAALGLERLFFLTNACKRLLWFGSRASVGEDQVLGFGPFIVHDLYCVMGLQFGFQLLESVLGCGDGYVGAIVV
jgi:hypothetical protein